MDIKPGQVYRHYKGTLYRVLCFATHTETEEQLVVYQAVESGKTFCRPVGMFDENMDTPDYQGPRFILQQGQ